MNDSNKLLTPTSASTTTTNNNTNSVNENNSENNTSSKLISPSTDEERNESEKCSNAAKQDAKEKIPVLNSEQWKKGTTLIVGDSMLAGLREAKLSRSKRIKVRYFPGGKTEDLQYTVYITYIHTHTYIHTYNIHTIYNIQGIGECQGNHNQISPKLQKYCHIITCCSNR